MTGTRLRISLLGLQTLVVRSLVQGLGLIASILISRALGPVGRGRYYLPVTIATIAFHIGNMGTEQAQFRMWSRKEAPRDSFVTSGAYLAAGLGTVTALSTWVAFLLGRTSVFSDIRAFDITIVIVTLPIQIHALLVSGLLIVDGRLAWTNLALLMGAFAQTAGVAFLYFQHRISVEAVLVLYAVSVVMPWAWMLPRLGKVGKLGAKVSRRLIGSQLKLGSSLQPYLLSQYLNLRIDVLLIAHVLTVREVGLYSVAVALSELIWLATSAVQWAVVERQANSPEEEALDVTLRAARISLLIAVGFGLVIAVGASLAIRLLYGKAFLPATSTVWALIPGAIAMAIWRHVTTILLRLAKVRFQSIMAVASLILNVAANLLLIPMLGIVGAGIASSISYGFGAALSVWWLVRYRGVVAAQFVPSVEEVTQLMRVLRPNSLRSEISRMFQR